MQLRSGHDKLTHDFYDKNYHKEKQYPYLKSQKVIKLHILQYDSMRIIFQIKYKYI